MGECFWSPGASLEDNFIGLPNAIKFLKVLFSLSLLINVQSLLVF